MRVMTRHFGELELDTKEIIRFEEGLPGFERLRDFFFIGSGDEHSPFKWLQCVNDPDTAFAVADPFRIVKDYQFELKEDAVESLRITNGEDLGIYVIVVVPKDVSRTSMNLKAPLVINTKDGRGAQIVLDTDQYTVRHYIMEEVRRQEGCSDAGADKEKGSDDHDQQ